MVVLYKYFYFLRIKESFLCMKFLVFWFNMREKNNYICGLIKKMISKVEIEIYLFDLLSWFMENCCLLGIFIVDVIRCKFVY